jgi:hypothetical protein
MVRRTLLLFTAMALAALALVAGPAISSKPYRPHAVDFELAVPAPAAAKAAGAHGTYTSPALKAPKRFNVVGMRWKGSAEHAHLELRVRKEGGTWTDWQEVEAVGDHAPDPRTGEKSATSASAPAWAGQADYVQFRSERPLPGAKFHFVNTTGTATAKDRRVTAFRNTINKGVVALAGAGQPTANAAEAQPPIVSRSEWGADTDCTPRSGASYGEVRAAFIHHTVNLNDYSQEEAADVVLGICRYHRNSNGWNDVGYNFLVDKYGTIYEGRAGGVDQAVLGAQAQGFNAQSTGIANIGTFTDVPQTNEALDAMARLIRWKLPLHGQPTAGTVQLTSAGGASNRFAAGTVVTLERIPGHRDGNETACPGAALYAQLPELRRRVGDLKPAPPTGTPQTATRIQFSAAPSVLLFPQGTQVRGQLVQTGGSAVAGARVELQRQSSGGGSFKTIERSVTGADGGFAMPFKPSKKAVVRVRFPGDGAHGATQSNPATVQVRPALTFSRPAKRIRAKGLVRIKGTISPSKSAVRIVLERKSGKGKKGRLGTIRVPVKNGRYVGRFRLTNPGLYRMYVAFFADGKNLSVSSPGSYVRVGRGSVRANEPVPPPPSTDTNNGGTSTGNNAENGGTPAKTR